MKNLGLTLMALTAMVMATAAEAKKVRYINDTEADIVITFNHDRQPEYKIPAGTFANPTSLEIDQPDFIQRIKVKERGTSWYNRNKTDVLTAENHPEINEEVIYVLTHNRLNPSRSFRLLTPKDMENRKLAKEFTTAVMDLLSIFAPKGYVVSSKGDVSAVYGASGIYTK